MICSSEKRLFLISISCETELSSERGRTEGQGHFRSRSVAFMRHLLNLFTFRTITPPHRSNFL